MTALKEKVNELSNLIATGHTIKAMELFYANDVEMQENNELPRKGKILCISHEKENLQKVKNFAGKLLNQAIDDANGVVFSEWEIQCTYNDDSKYILTEVAVQHWADGLVVKENFYYKDFNKIES
jgi:hypothetical protein